MHIKETRNIKKNISLLFFNVHTALCIVFMGKYRFKKNLKVTIKKQGITEYTHTHTQTIFYES